MNEPSHQPMPRASQLSVVNQWWRWPLIPFAAFIGGALAAIAFWLLQWFAMKMKGGMSEDGWMFLYVLPTFRAAAFGWFYAWISCAVAPRGKVITGIVMVTILTLLGLVNITLAWLLPKYSGGEAIEVTIAAVVASVGAVLAVMAAHEKSKGEPFS